VGRHMRVILLPWWWLLCSSFQEMYANSPSRRGALVMCIQWQKLSRACIDVSDVVV